MPFARYKRFLYSFFIIFASHAIANEEDNEIFQFSGFATVGAVYTDSEHYGYRKHVGSNDSIYYGEVDFKQHSLLGLQADWSISANFNAVYQGVLRDLPEQSFDRLTTLAFLRYEVNTNWNIRVGRTAPDLFLLTEYRDVDFSYIWATAPNEVYSIIPYRSIDGIDVSYSKRGFGGVFTSKIFTGSSEAEISADTIIEEIKIEDIIGISLTFDHYDWVVHTKHSQVTIANESQSNLFAVDGINQIPDILWPNSQTFAQSLLMKGNEVNYSSVSGQYQWRNWLASVEFSQINSDSKVIPKILSSYAALSYQVNTHQFYGIYAFTDSDIYVFNEPGVNKELLGEAIQGTTDLLNFYVTNQETISLGWRWDITNQMASSLQWNFTRIQENSSGLWLSEEDHKAADDVNTFLFTLSLIF